MTRAKTAKTSTVRALRNTVQRRGTSTRRELFRQLAPLSKPVSERLLHTQRMRLERLGDGCVYCGAHANTVDHLEPLVRKGMPTGLIPTQLDVLPCCSRCNSSKGAHPWREYMKRLNWPASNHGARVSWLSSYDRWRRRHAQRWSVASHATLIQQLNNMVDECHAFMQATLNQYVQQIHGNQAVLAHARSTRWDWSTILCQMMACA